MSSVIFSQYPVKRNFSSAAALPHKEINSQSLGSLLVLIDIFSFRRCIPGVFSVHCVPRGLLSCSSFSYHCRSSGCGVFWCWYGILPGIFIQENRCFFRRRRRCVLHRGSLGILGLVIKKLLVLKPRRTLKLLLHSCKTERATTEARLSQQ